ncbi:uncharacterized protein [Epargyreus clarus]|uniref:uncharacterized protein n=1 Tax=Epargyreus clarus TaxID=520877 RepID=UPI003C2FFCDC
MNTETFIAEILARPAIWQSYHPHYKYKHTAKKLWEEIKSKHPNTEVADLKKKWKNLRDTYSKELKKIHKSQSKASSSNSESTWKYFTLLQFLKDEYMPFLTESNLDEDSNEMDENDDIPVEDLCEKTPSPSPSCSSFPNDSFTITQPLKRKQQSIQDIRAEYLEMERKKLKILEKDIYKDKRDDIQRSDDYHFLMSILPEMEKLPPMQKLRLRNKINQALLDEMCIVYGEPNRR